jgi:hypothetical protein
MANIKLDTVRAGVKLLSAVMKEADNQGRADGKVSAKEIKSFIDQFGDGGKLDDAMNKLFKYAQASTGKAAPTATEINKALSQAMKSIANADTNKNGLSASEEKTLAKTWKSIVEFATEYKGTSVDDIVAQGNHE